MQICHNNADGLMDHVAQLANLDAAYAMVRKKSLKQHHNHPFWDLALRWDTVRISLSKDLRDGSYVPGPLVHTRGKDGELVGSWEGVDQVVAKAISLVLEPLIRSRYDLDNVYHIKGRGGIKGALAAARLYQRGCKYVYKTDIADYYGSLSHKILKEKLRVMVQDERLLYVLGHFMHRAVVYRGEYRLIDNYSVARGCPLSPLFGTIYLSSLDAYAKKRGLRYIRYMDDLLFFTHSSHQLRRVIKAVYRLIEPLALRLAKDKTRITKVSNGFDFLGYRISRYSITVSMSTWDRFRARLLRLHEQRGGLLALKQYIRHWVRWATAGAAVEKQQLLQKIQTILHFLIKPTEHALRLRA